MTYVLQYNIADAGKPEAWRTAEYFTEQDHALAVLAQMPDPTVWRIKSSADLPRDAAQTMIAWRNDYY
jgi:hypothetical protein